MNRNFSTLLLLMISVLLSAQNMSVKELDVVDLTKAGIIPGNYSGITWLGGDRYAIVSDKESADGFFPLTLSLNRATGKVEAVERGALRGNVSPVRGADGNSIRDCEGIVWHKPTSSFFISGEGDQQILEYDTIGQPTGRKLAVPVEMSLRNITGNQGFEALAYNDKTHLFWTTTESTLPADGVAASYDSRQVANVLRIQSFDESLSPASQYAYRMDLPTLEHRPRQYAFGVPAITALDDGRLLVLEREFYVSRSILGSYVENRLYLVNPSRSTTIDFSVRLNSLSDTDFMAKTLLHVWRTDFNFRSRGLANYEGMCLGPRLDDGRQTLLLICDSQGGYGNSLASLHDFVKVLALQ